MQSIWAEYTALAQQIASLEAQKQAVADKIKDAMGEAEEVQAGAYTARYKAVTSSRFDAKAFQQAHKKLYSGFLPPADCPPLQRCQRMKKAPYLCAVGSKQVKSRNTAVAGSVLIIGPAR